MLNLIGKYVSNLSPKQRSIINVKQHPKRCVRNVKRLLTDIEFRVVLLIYIEKCPSVHFKLNCTGQKMNANLFVGNDNCRAGVYIHFHFVSFFFQLKRFRRTESINYEKII